MTAPTRGGIFRPLRPILAALLLSSCAWDQYTAAYPTATVASQPDPAAQLILQCDRLGFSRSSDGHRLCVMRGVDRLRVQQGTGYAPIQILPHAYPPLVPPGTITVVPAR